MLGGLGETISNTTKALVHKAAKYMDPEAYVLDAQNEELYSSVVNAINDKDIATLRNTQFPDQNGMMQTLEFTFGRVVERQVTLTSCILNQSLVQDPVKEDKKKLLKMATVNVANITDIHFALIIKALQEKGCIKKSIANTGNLRVDIELFKISLLSEAEQLLLKSNLQGDDEPLSVEQKRNLAEMSFLSLSSEDREKVLERITSKKPASSSSVNTNKQTRTNTPTKSRKDTSKQSSDQDEGNSDKQKEMSVRSKKKADKSSSVKSIDKDQQEQLDLEENQKKVGSNAEKQEDFISSDDDLDNQEDFISSDDDLDNEDSATVDITVDDRSDNEI